MVAKNHYEDCPYGCNVKGMLLDTNIGKMIPCPHCSKKKAELLKQGYAESETDEQIPLSTILGVGNEYLSAKFVYDSVIPDGERLFIDEESMEWQKEIADELYLGLTVGDLPTQSYCFGISIKGRIDRFVYPMLAKAYLSNLTVGKFVTCSEFCRMDLDSSVNLKDFYESDLLFMLINDGSTLAGLSSAKGLMQARAMRGKATIFVTTWTIEACSGLLGFNEDSSMFMAKPVFIKYKSGKNKSEHSSYINGLLGVENKNVSAKGNIGDLLK